MHGLQTFSLFTLGVHLPFQVLQTVLLVESCSACSASRDIFSSRQEFFTNGQRRGRHIRVVASVRDLLHCPHNQTDATLAEEQSGTIHIVVAVVLESSCQCFNSHNTDILGLKAHLMWLLPLACCHLLVSRAHMWLEQHCVCTHEVPAPSVRGSCHHQKELQQHPQSHPVEL